MRTEAVKYCAGIPAILVVALSACTAVKVRPVEGRSKMANVCIERNPAVQVDDFLPVLRDGLSRNGVRSFVFAGEPPADCVFIVAYTARRSWDLAPYLAHAEIRVERGGLQVGYGEFHLRGGGGYSMFKWQGTKTKMDPVIDRLFADRALQ
jgi:hypothetical protein